MRRYLAALILLLSGYLSATTVTGTIQDINGNRYSNGTVSAFNLITGASMTPAATDANGTFSITLAPSTYQFTVCAKPVNIGPNGGTSVTQVCAQPPTPIVISGGSQDVSTQINAVAPILGPSVAALLGANNAFIGNNTHAGLETFNGLVAVNNILTGAGSAAIAGTFGGSPTMTGNWTMQGNNSFTGSNTYCLIDNAYVAGSSCYATIQAAVTAAGTLGEVLIPAGYAGVDTYTNPNNLVIDDRRSVIAGTGFNYNNVGFWQNTQNTLGISSLLGACDPKVQFQRAQSSNFFTSAVTGCAQPPVPPKSVWQAAGVTGFCNATDNTNCVGVYGQGYADNPTPYTVASSSCLTNVVTFSLTGIPQIATGTQVLIAGISGIGAGANGLYTLSSGAYNTAGPFTYAATCTNGSGSGGTLKAGAKTWGMNCWVGGQAGSSPVAFLQCLEADANPPDAATLGSVVDCDGAFSFNSGMNCFAVGVPVGGGKWSTGLIITSGCCNVAGIYMSPIAAGNSQNSNTLDFVGTDSGGVPHGANVYGSPNGDLIVQPSSSAQILNDTGGLQVAGASIVGTGVSINLMRWTPSNDTGGAAFYLTNAANSIIQWQVNKGGGTSQLGSSQATQQIANQGTACTNGELALSAGWQSTGSATVTAVAGTGQTCSWTITTGTTTAANPTITDTLTNALPAATTVCEMNIHGGTHTAVAGEYFNQTALSATVPVFTANFTPTAGGTTYFVTRRCGP